MTKKKRILFSMIILGGYLVLLIPDVKPKFEQPAKSTPFTWVRDEYWASLENIFNKAKQQNIKQLETEINAGFSKCYTLRQQLKDKQMLVDDPFFDTLEKVLFELASKIAAHPKRLKEYISLVSKIRKNVKRQSIHWNFNIDATKERIYTLLYGLRMATEEVMLQHPLKNFPAVIKNTAVSSKTPSAKIRGITIHSGDLLVSRGGAATSALISRGNNYQGNFSHVALVHVGEIDGKVSIIEAHIEAGVVISSVESYLNDTKLRLMVLRLREDHPFIQKDPFIAHKAAVSALTYAKNRRIPYDFSMDFTDDSKLFCSEVASKAYGEQGIDLWMDISKLYSPGVVSWLGEFGVRHFKTQAPSDLEYDPQLTVVAEFRNPELLFADHVDNAVIDAMLELADEGVKLNYNIFLLPFARILKALSVLVNLFDKIGPIPKGMNATTALKNEWFSTTHKTIKTKTLVLADQFKNKNGYRPPYFQLLPLARKSANEHFKNLTS